MATTQSHSHSLETYKRRAKDLLRAFRAAEPEALARIRKRFDNPRAENFRLAQAQLAIAREAGYPSWARLRRALGISPAPRTMPGNMAAPGWVGDVDRLDGKRAWVLFQACRDGRIDEVRALLDAEPALVNAQEWYTHPLHFAVRKGHMDIVALLLERGAEPGRSNWTYRAWGHLLEAAKERGDTSCLRLLEETLRKRYGYREDFATAVEAIRSFDRERILKILGDKPELAAGADAKGSTLAHWAAITRQTWLLDHTHTLGLPLDRLRCDGQAPAHLALYGDYHYRHLDTDFRKAMQGDALPGPTEVAKHLVDLGAEYDLSLACRLGDLERVREILRHDPTAANRLDTARRSPLLHAAHGHIEVVRLLLENGADPNQPELHAPRGGALIRAASMNDLEMTRLLLEHGADPNATEDSSGNPISIVNRDKADAQAVVDLLKAHGGHIGHWDWSVEQVRDFLRPVSGAFNPGASPLGLGDWILRDWLARGNLEVVDLLAARLGPSLPGLHGGHLPEPKPRDRTSPVLKRLLELGWDPNRPDWVGKTALHHYAEHGSDANIRLLLDHGAEIDAIEDESEGTPLAWAARKGHTATVRLLLERGANPKLPLDQDSAQPLAQARRNGHVEAAALLGKAME